MIETKGLVAAIEALDASLKAAHVRLAGIDVVSGGLVTIRVTGDVGAVSAAVWAGSTAAKKVGTLVSAHVIPRPHPGLGDIAYGPGSRGRIGSPRPGPRPSGAQAEPPKEQPQEEVQSGTEGEAPAESSIEASLEGEALATERVKHIVKGTDVEELVRGAGRLSELSVSKLRKIARYIPGIRLSGIEISNARKDQLLSEIISAVLEGGIGENAN